MVNFGKMHSSYLAITTALAIIVNGAQGEGEYIGTLVDSTVSGVNIDDTEEAVYDCTVTSNWSGANHPADYPVNAHLSFPVLVSHSENYNMWDLDTQATPGVQKVAEFGPTDVLETELTAAGADIYATKIGTVMWNTDVGNIPADHIIGREQTIEGLKVSPSHLYISTITMCAPSPDWFSGFSNFEPGSDDDKWLASFTIDTQPYDAGTDSGVTFKADDLVTDPQEMITELTVDTTPGDIFKDATGETILPVVSWTCLLVASTPAKAAASSIFSGFALAMLAMTLTVIFE
jgi:hypothetical protein